MEGKKKIKKKDNLTSLYGEEKLIFPPGVKIVEL